MRFLFVSEFSPRWNSGAEGTLLAAGDALGKRGNQVDYIWKDKSSRSLIHPRYYEYFSLPKLQMKRVGAALRKTKYDVVVVSQPYGYPVFEALSRRHPDVVFLNRTHGWEERLSEACSRFQWRTPSSFTTPLRLLSGSLLAQVSRRTARACTGFLAGSNLCADYVRNRYSLHPGAVAAIPYGADLPIGAPLARIDARTDKRNATRLLYVGQYLPRKGSKVMESVLPGIAGMNPAVELTCVVPDDAVPQVQAVFAPHFGKRLKVRPWVTREELTGIYQEHDILLFPSLFEGFGKVFLEGMACGLCVAGFREGGFPDIATDGQDAMICPVGDTAAFGNLVQRAISEPARARELGMRARETARHYTWDRHAKETENFCLRLKYGAPRAAIAS